MSSVNFCCSVCEKKMSSRGVRRVPSLPYNFCKKCKMEYIDKNLFGDKGTAFLIAEKKKLFRGNTQK